MLPDQETAARGGLTVAHRLALEELLAQAGDAATRTRLKATLQQLSGVGE